MPKYLNMFIDFKLFIYENKTYKEKIPINKKRKFNLPTHNTNRLKLSTSIYYLHTIILVQISHRKKTYNYINKLEFAFKSAQNINNEVQLLPLAI